tara:strand:- start:73 stop:687 length:615 start_codon:yes stop_codon:yes gene_type:complete
MTLHTESSQDETLTLYALAKSGVNEDGTKYELSDLENEQETQIKNPFRQKQFQVFFTSQIASNLTFGVKQIGSEEEEVFVFLKSDLPLFAEIPSHILEVSKNIGEITTPDLPEGRVTSIAWALPSKPSRRRTLSRYRLEGLTETDEWRLITEFSTNQSDESKSLLDIVRCSHVRLRFSSKWITGKASRSVPVGSISFLEISEKE